MYGTTNRCSFFSLLFSMMIIFSSFCLTVYASASDMNTYTVIALIFLLISLAAYTFLTIIALRSLRQELEWEFEQDSKTIKELKQRIQQLEKSSMTYNNFAKNP